MNGSVCALMTRSTWLFDLDGTLIDSSAGIVRAFHFAQENKHKCPARGTHRERLIVLIEQEHILIYYAGHEGLKISLHRN